ncbi:hypothetical protein FRC20_007888, partial [Serendipita sp. 405]
LLDFFRYFSRDFNYGSSVASIRAGHLPKDSFEPYKSNDPRDGTSLWIEDPFATDFNVGRCVTRDGLYTIRGEFMRALRILNARHGAPMAPMSILASLCEENDTEVPKSACLRNSYRHTGSPRSQSAGVSPVIPRLGLNNNGNQSQESFKPQFAPSTPITLTAPPSNPPIISVPAMHASSTGLPQIMVPPPHMAPQRGKWTSPPPDHAPPQRHNSFNERLATGIKMAVTHRPMERSRTRSSPGSSATDEDVDDVPDGGFLDTRSSSPLSSTSIPEFIPQHNTVTQIIEEDTSSTPKPILPSESSFQPPFPHPHTEGKSREFPSTRINLPSLTIPPLYPPPPYSANAHQWPMDYGSTHMGRVPPPRSNYGYRDGPRHGRSNFKAYAPNNSYAFSHPRAQYSPHYAPSFSNATPQQLPTPPVSSPCSNQQHSPPSTSSPLLRLDELASTSAR